MKVLFVILNNIENKAKLINLIDRYKGYLLPEIIHIPISVFNWDEGCYSLEGIINVIRDKTQKYSVDYVIGIGNLKICDKGKKNGIEQKGKIIVIEEKNTDNIDLDKDLILL